MADVRPRRPRHAVRQPGAHAAVVRAPRWRAVLLAVGAAILGLVVLSGAATIVVPPVATNLSSETAASDVPMESANNAVRGMLPAGWTAQHPFLRDAELTVRSPDGRLTIAFTAVPQAPDDAYAALVARYADAGPALSESLASGLVARHADTADGRTLIAAVGLPDGPSATAVATVDADAPADYRPAIADILDSVRVGP